MQKKHSNNEDLSKIAPMLYSIGKRNPFKVPDGYFDNLPALIQARCTKEKTAVIRDMRYYMLRIALPVASAAAIVLFIVTLSLRQANNSRNISDLTFVDMGANVEDEIMGSVDENLLMEAIEENGVFNAEKAVDPETDAMIDYLIDQDIDESLIANQL